MLKRFTFCDTNQTVEDKINGKYTYTTLLLPSCRQRFPNTNKHQLRRLLTPYLFYTLTISRGWCKIFTSQTKSKTKTSRILLVDDEPDVAVTIEAVLEESGFFQVDPFSDAISALSVFRSGAYDLALLDIKMPGMNGFELYKKLREIDKKMKICFLTAAELGYYRETDSDVINELGTNCFIAKPVNNSEIIERLKILLSM